MDKLSTREKLRLAGKQEFLAKGYKDASLREIVKIAGFTLGAFYGYYSSKEALFEDIVGEAAQTLYCEYTHLQATFDALPQDEQPKNLDTYTEDSLLRIVDVFYSDMTAFKLVFFRSAGTSYEGYLQRLIDLEILSIQQLIGMMKEQGYPLQIDDEIVHILASAMFTAIIELVDHDMDREKAVHYVSQLRAFYSAGWHNLLGI